MVPQTTVSPSMLFNEEKNRATIDKCQKDDETSMSARVSSVDTSFGSSIHLDSEGQLLSRVSEASEDCPGL